MKKIFFVLMVSTLVILSCASSAEHTKQISTDKMLEPGESLVTVQRIRTFKGAIINMQIWVDDEKIVGGIKNGVQSSIVIPNGSHTIQAGSTKIDRGNKITFTVNDEEICFLANPVFGILATRFHLTETSRKKINLSVSSKE
jgi:hypothetical protein